MKTLLHLFAFCIVMNFTSSAQFATPNQKIIGASFSFNSGDGKSSNYPDDNFRNTSFNVNINAGKFNNKKILSSFTLGYVGSVSKHITATNTSINNVDGVFASYGKTFYKEVAKKLFFGIGGFFGINYGAAKVNNTQSSDRSTSESYSAGISIFPTLSYQLTNRFVINAGPATSFLGLNYNYSTAKAIQGGQTIATSKFHSLNLNAGFTGSLLSNISLGFSYLLKKK